MVSLTLSLLSAALSVSTLGRVVIESRIQGNIEQAVVRSEHEFPDGRGRDPSGSTIPEPAPAVGRSEHEFPDNTTFNLTATVSMAQASLRKYNW